MAAGNARNSILLNYRVDLLYDLTEFNLLFSGTAGSNPALTAPVVPVQLGHRRFASGIKLGSNTGFFLVPKGARIRARFPVQTRCASAGSIYGVFSWGQKSPWTSKTNEATPLASVGCAF